MFKTLVFAVLLVSTTVILTGCHAGVSTNDGEHGAAVKVD